MNTHTISMTFPHCQPVASLIPTSSVSNLTCVSPSATGQNFLYIFNQGHI